MDIKVEGEIMGEFNINGKHTPIWRRIKDNGKTVVCSGRFIELSWTPFTNYFRMPNDIFNLDLSVGEISVYAFLMRMENRVTYTCFPSYKTIGKALKMSKNTVAKYVHSLEDKKLIELESTSVIDKNGRKRNGNLQYKILPISVAVQDYYNRQLANYGMKNSR